MNQKSYTVDLSKQYIQKNDPWSHESKKLATGEVGVSDPTGDINQTFGKTSDGSAFAEVSQEFEGNNPLVFGSPDIEVRSLVKLTENKVKNQLNVTIDLFSKAFPATEAFIEDASGQKVFLSGAAAFGKPTHLILAGENKVGSVNVTINLDDAGNFTNVTVGKANFSLDAFNSIATSRPAGPNDRSEFNETYHE